MNTNTEAPKFPTCKCGCGKGVRFTNATYLPGHDAKHKGNIAREILATGDKNLINNLPSLALQNQAKELVVRWAAKGKAPGAKGKTPKVETVEDNTKYEVKIGRWTYPVKKHGSSFLRNDRRDGTGEWGTMDADQIKKVTEA